jgi:hypothetical protein
MVCAGPAQADNNYKRQTLGDYFEALSSFFSSFSVLSSMMEAVTTPLESPAYSMLSIFRRSLI